jgi:hypothetical protein
VTGFQGRRLGEIEQLDRRLLESSLRFRDVQLHDVPSRTRTVIGDANSEFDVVIGREGDAFRPERRVAQAVAEGEHHVHPEGREVPVPDIDPFLVDGVDPDVALPGVGRSAAGSFIEVPI